MYSHSKRILPRKDELNYRTEFPSNATSHYYSSSSVYSYSPTSSSDCPEHGRSHRRIKYILIFSVIFATLGVLSIAGIAGYLGYLSKSIQSVNVDAQNEEFLFSTSANGKSDEILRGRSDFSLPHESNILSAEEPITKTHPYDYQLTSNGHRPFIINEEMERGAEVASVPHLESPSLIIPHRPSKTKYSPSANQRATTTKPNNFSTNQRAPTTKASIFSTNQRERTTTSSFLPTNEREGTTPASFLPTNEREALTTPKIIISSEGAKKKIGIGTVSDHNEENERNVNAQNTQNNRLKVVYEHTSSSPAAPAQPKLVKTQEKGKIETFVPIDPFFTHNKENKNVNIKTNIPIVLENENKTTENSQNSHLLANHKSHLNFDRVEDVPEMFYEKQEPWMPLLIRPISIQSSSNERLDKRPRLELESIPQINYQSHQNQLKNKEVERRPPSIFDNLPKTNPHNVNYNEDFRKKGDNVHKTHTQSSNFPKTDVIDVDFVKNLRENSQNIGHKVQNEEMRKTQSVIQVESAEIKEPIRSGFDLVSYEDDDYNHPQNEDENNYENKNTPVNSISIFPLSTQEQIEKDDKNEKSEKNEKIEEKEEEDLRKPIPAFTLTIPHIPNPPSKQETTNLDSLLKENEENLENLESDLAKESRENLEKEQNSEEEEYEDEIEEKEKNKNEPANNVYKLDVNNTDMVPEVNPIFPESHSGFKNNEEEKIKNLDEKVIDKLEENKKEPEFTAAILLKSPPVEENSSNPEIKSSTDFILSSLGSLNLVKTSPGDFYKSPNTTSIENKVEKIEENSKNESISASSPLFPPTRSYVSVNLPLRPKPDDLESKEEIYLVSDPEKKLRLVNSDGLPLSADLTTTSSLNKVLSMMMNFEEGEKITTGSNMTLHNVSLLVANSSREHKSIFSDEKIDETGTRVQIPVPLILQEHLRKVNIDENSKILKNRVYNNNQTNNRGSWTPTKLSSLSINKNNSPVYKFVLKKGQTVEDLLKEIFSNYTDKGIGATTNPSSTKAPSSNLNINETKNLTLAPSIPVKISEKIDEEKELNETTTTEKNVVVQTSTSVVVNEEMEQGVTLPNGTFRCSSSGLLLSAFARCNNVKECPDNSDEKNCKCVDYLKSQMLHRKVCDGVVDCADESDEAYCDWCSPGQYICSGSRACVPRTKICDSKRDCPRGDDESNCVKIGHSGLVEEFEDISPIYHQSGYLMVRKKGVWGKLCVETFSSVLSHWEIKDLARAVCKAKTFSDFESVEKVEDEESGAEPYYELYNGNGTDEESSEENSSSSSTPRSSIGFKISPCKTKMVVKVQCQDLQCGTAPRAFTQAARIVGGSNALPGEWPWQAALYRDGEYQCGATLISSRWLLSAGHCFYHAQDDYWVARLGTLRRGGTVMSPYEQSIKITHIFLHPNYKDIGFVNDVSLLRLEEEVKFTDFVRPVCLPSKDTKIKDGRICTVVGWGQLFETGRVFPDTLQEVQLPLISTSECRKRTLFLPLYKLTDEMFCAGFDRGGRDACLGDSGGPLMCPENDGRWSLYGVTSNGYGCARANRPGVYTKTKSYLDWVYDKMSQDSSFTYRDKSKPCPGHRCLLGECLETKSICNGITDCVDGSDERNCTWNF